MFFSTAFKFLVLIFLFVFNPISIFGFIKDTSLNHHQGKSLINNVHDLDTAAFTFRKKKKKKEHHHYHHHHHEIKVSHGKCSKNKQMF